jgi:hypothetical protein
MDVPQGLKSVLENSSSARPVQIRFFQFTNLDGA